MTPGKVTAKALLTVFPIFYIHILSWGLHRTTGTELHRIPSCLAEKGKACIELAQKICKMMECGRKQNKNESRRQEVCEIHRCVVVTLQAFFCKFQGVSRAVFKDFPVVRYRSIPGLGISGDCRNSVKCIFLCVLFNEKYPFCSIVLALTD